MGHIIQLAVTYNYIRSQTQDGKTTTIVILIWGTAYLTHWRALFKETYCTLHVSVDVEVFENVQWMLALVRLHSSDICILSILPPILCPPPALYPYLTRAQWTVLPWEWDAARMMPTITVAQHMYLIRHNSIYQFKVPKQSLLFKIRHFRELGIQHRQFTR